MMTPIQSKDQLIKEIAESLDCSSQSSNPYVFDRRGRFRLQQGR